MRACIKAPLRRVGETPRGLASKLKALGKRFANAGCSASGPPSRFPFIPTIHATETSMNGHRALLILAGMFLPTLGHAQDGCANRGDLDAQYCDADRDLVADTPTDPS